jgi:hypothetical protein
VGQSVATDLGAVEVLMEDGTWEPGRLLAIEASREGCRAKIRWAGITGWFWRSCGRGHVNEWRYAHGR